MFILWDSQQDLLPLEELECDSPWDKKPPPSPGHSEVHGVLIVAVPLVIKFSDLGLDVPQFILQVVAASLLVQEARILGGKSCPRHSRFSFSSL